MIEKLRLLRPFTQRIDKAVTSVARKCGKGCIADEDDFTSQLLARIESELDNWKPDGIVFQTKKTTSKGKGSEESIFGADIFVTMNINLRDYKTNKGIFIQAKRLDHGKVFNNRLWSTLCGKIKTMKRYTSDSYVWLYDSSGVRSIRAHAVYGLQTKRPDDLYSTRCATFLGAFLQSKHGDSRITEDFIQNPFFVEFSPIRHMLSFSVSEKDRERDRIS